MSVCTCARVGCVCLCVCTIRECVTEKDTSSKKCSLLSPEVFFFLTFREQRLQPLTAVRGISGEKSAPFPGIFFFLTFLSSKNRGWCCTRPLPSEIQLHRLRMKVERYESVPMPEMLAKDVGSGFPYNDVYRGLKLELHDAYAFC